MKVQRENLNDRAPETMRPRILNRAESGDFGGFALEDLPCGVCGTVVHHDNFVRNSVQSNLEVEMLDGGSNATLLVPRRDDNREQRERSSGLGFRRVGHFYSFSIQTGRPAFETGDFYQRVKVFGMAL
jgi:hypothetical protein